MEDEKHERRPIQSKPGRCCGKGRAFLFSFLGVCLSVMSVANDESRCVTDDVNSECSRSINFRHQLREAHGLSAARAENLSGVRTRDSSEGATFPGGPKEIRDAAPECPKVDPSSAYFRDHDTAGDYQMISPPRGAETTCGYQSRTERTEPEAATSAAIEASQFPHSKQRVASTGKNVDGRNVMDENPVAKEQRAILNPPHLNLLHGTICPECKIATCQNKQGTCTSCRVYIRNLAQRRNMSITEFRANAARPESEERQLFNAALVQLRGGKIANNWFRTQTFTRSTVDREGAFKTADEVVEMEFEAIPVSDYDPKQHPGREMAHETRTMENPWTKSIEPHLLFKKTAGATSQNSCTLKMRTKVGRVESRSRKAEESVTNVTCHSWDANAPPSPSDGKTHSVPHTQTGPSDNTARPEKFPVCDSRDFSSDQGQIAKFDLSGPQAADGQGNYENEHQRRRETLTHSYPSDGNYDEMLIRLRLSAEKDAPKTGGPGSTRMNNFSAAKEVDATTLLETIARRTRLSELYSVVVQSSNKAAIPYTESRASALEQWNEVACEILEKGEAQGTAQWCLIRDTIATNAAAKSRALEIFTTEYELEGDMLMGPQAHTPHKMRQALKKAPCAGLIFLGWAGIGRINGKTRGLFCDLSNQMQIDLLPNVIYTLLQRWKGNDQKQATKALKDIQKIGQLYEDLEADAETSGKVIAPELYKYFTLAKLMGCDFINKPTGVTAPTPDAPSVKTTRKAIEEMTKESQQSSSPMAFLYTHTLSVCRQAVLNTYEESDRTARILNNIEVAEAKIELTIKETSRVRELAPKRNAKNPQGNAPDAEKSSPTSNGEHDGILEKWFQGVELANDCLASASQFFPKMEQEKSDGATDKGIKHKEAGDRIRSIRQQILDNAKTLVAEIRKSAIPFLYGVTDTTPSGPLQNDIVVIEDEQSLTGTPGGRVIDCDARWNPPPSLGLAATKEDRKNALNAGRMSKMWRVLQDIAKSVRSVRKKEQSEMTAIRNAIGELGKILRALSTAHVAVAKHLEASRPEPRDDPTAAAQPTTFSEADLDLQSQLDETWPNGKPPPTWELPAIMQYLLGIMHTALEKLRADDRDLADMWEIVREFAWQADNYKNVRTEFQKKIDDASNIQVCEALENIADGNIDRFATMDIEKQPGYKTYREQWALKFEDGATALIAKTKPRVVFPTEQFPRMFTTDFFSTLIEEAATADGVNYEFRAPPSGKRTRALNAQRKLREWWADIRHTTDIVRRLLTLVPKKFLTDNVTVAKAQMEKAYCEVFTQQKFAMGMMNAILHKENSVKLHRQVLEASKRMAEGKPEEIALPMGRILFDVAFSMCALFHYQLPDPVPPPNPAQLYPPLGSRDSNPNEPARSSASVQDFDKWAAEPAAASKRTSVTPETMDPRVARDIIQEFATPAEPPIHIAVETGHAAERTSTEIATPMAGAPHTAAKVLPHTAPTTTSVEGTRTRTQREEMLRGPDLPTQIIPRGDFFPSEVRRLPNDSEIPPRQDQEQHTDDRVARKQNANRNRTAEVGNGGTKRVLEHNPTEENDEMDRKRRRSSRRFTGSPQKPKAVELPDGRLRIDSNPKEIHQRAQVPVVATLQGARFTTGIHSPIRAASKNPQQAPKKRAQPKRTLGPKKPKNAEFLEKCQKTHVPLPLKKAAATKSRQPGAPKQKARKRKRGGLDEASQKTTTSACAKVPPKKHPSGKAPEAQEGLATRQLQKKPTRRNALPTQETASESESVKFDEFEKKITSADPPTPYSIGKLQGLFDSTDESED